MRTHRQRAIVLLTCLILVVALAACAGTPADTAAQTQPTATPIPTAPAAARPTYVVQKGTVQELLAFSGRWLPRDQLELSFEIAGNIRSVNVRRGDTVVTGMLLADYQITDLENSLASAELDLQTAELRLTNSSDGSETTITSSTFNLASANLDLESQENSYPWSSVESARIQVDNAQRDLESAQRSYDLAVSDPSSPGSSVDSAYDRLESAKSSLTSAWINYFNASQSYLNYDITIARAENTVLQREMDLAQAYEGAGVDPELVQSVLSAQLRVDQIRSQIAQSSLFAPIDGVVLEVNISPGDGVQAYDGIITIAIPDPKEAIVNLAFNDTQRLSVGMIGTCQELNRPETKVQCIVRQVPLSSREADQTVRIAASFNELALGQIVEIEMPLQVRDNVLWLPPAAIRTFQNRTFVVLDTPDGQRVVDVEIGLQTDDRVEIVSGVSEGDVVVGP